MSPKSFFSSSTLTLGPNEKHRGPFELTRKLFCLKKWDEVRLQNRAWLLLNTSAPEQDMVSRYIYWLQTMSNFGTFFTGNLEKIGKHEILHFMKGQLPTCAPTDVERKLHGKALSQKERKSKHYIVTFWMNGNHQIPSWQQHQDQCPLPPLLQPSLSVPRRRYGLISNGPLISMVNMVVFLQEKIY